ncbi:hypothetical protein [Microvirga alba]|uniref:Uncharacterized protein n=1 Tax=Microvirga alba TaxID=2791025 RepID=A0A931BXG4_9HYPH|nr:hypothetical protein [Microvirga alba]MBF9235630.1 hypothetical protein [Microvirga alba]
MRNLYSVTTAQEAMRRLFKVRHDSVGKKGLFIKENAANIWMAGFAIIAISYFTFSPSGAEYRTLDFIIRAAIIFGSTIPTIVLHFLFSPKDDE